MILFVSVRPLLAERRYIGEANASSSSLRRSLDPDDLALPLQTVCVFLAKGLGTLPRSRSLAFKVAVEIVKDLKIYALAMLVGFMAIQQAFGQSVPEEEMIRETRAKSNVFISRHDALGVTSLLDSEYQITTGNGEFFQESPGEDADAWTQIFEAYDDVTYLRTPKSIDVSTYLPLAYEISTWTGSWTTSDGPKEIGGHYSASWRKVNGQWRIRAELFVTLYCNGAGC